MNEFKISCHNCKAEIKLTESLAAPILESARRQYEQKMAQKDEEIQKREAAIRQDRAALIKSREEMGQKIADKLQIERKNIAIAEAKKAQDSFADQIAKMQQEKADTEQRLKDRESRLKEAQTNELKLRNDRQRLQDDRDNFELDKQRAIDTEREKIAKVEAKKAQDAFAIQIAEIQQEKEVAEKLLKDRESRLKEAQANELELRNERQKLQEDRDRFDLDMQRELDRERAKIRENALKDADAQMLLKMAEKEKMISDLNAKIDDLSLKAKQGSQQLQGEVQELILEQHLRLAFPLDSIEPVPKGEFGGDIIQRIVNPFGGQFCGTILWESKRTKNWSDSWLSKLREDQRSAKADMGIIVSQVLPQNIKMFDLVDGVWIVEPKSLIPFTIVIRQYIIELYSARQVNEGQQTKMEMVYQYLTGPQFRHRIKAIVEKFSEMKEDLEKERKLMMKQWSKREEQIRIVIDSTVGMYGDLQGIAGQSLKEIDELDIKMLTNA